jgi:hypothetical protein
MPRANRYILPGYVYHPPIVATTVRSYYDADSTELNTASA